MLLSEKMRLIRQSCDIYTIIILVLVFICPLLSGVYVELVQTLSVNKFWVAGSWAMEFSIHSPNQGTLFVGHDVRNYDILTSMFEDGGIGSSSHSGEVSNVKEYNKNDNLGIVFGCTAHDWFVAHKNNTINRYQSKQTWLSELKSLGILPPLKMMTIQRNYKKNQLILWIKRSLVWIGLLVIGMFIIYKRVKENKVALKYCDKSALNEKPIELCNNPDIKGKKIILGNAKGIIKIYSDFIIIKISRHNLIPWFVALIFWVIVLDPLWPGDPFLAILHLVVFGILSFVFFSNTHEYTFSKGDNIASHIDGKDFVSLQLTDKRWLTLKLQSGYYSESTAEMLKRNLMLQLKSFYGENFKE